MPLAAAAVVPGNQREAEQGRDVAARDHPIIDLQHIERARKHQDIDHAAEWGDAEHPPRALAQTCTYGIIDSRRGSKFSNPNDGNTRTRP